MKRICNAFLKLTLLGILQVGYHFVRVDDILLMSAQASAAGRPVSGAAAAAGQPQRREQKGIIGQLVQALAVYFLISGLLASLEAL